MADQRKGGISWTQMTWNPVRGCSRVSEGCRFCYAERVAARFSGPGEPYDGLAKNTVAGPRWAGVVRLVPEHLDDPLRWKRPRMVFVNSMSDLFHEGLGFDDDIRPVFEVMAAAKQHVFQVLTKRPQRMVEYFRAYPGVWFGPQRDAWLSWPLPNVWLGVSVEDQKTADERIPLLLQTPAAVRWVSYEPALGPVDFDAWLRPTFGPNCVRGPSNLNWIVCGGESGPGARPMHPAWARSARDQCVAAGVAFHFKQRGAWTWERPAPADWLAKRVSSWGVIDRDGHFFEQTTPWNGRTGEDSETGEECVYRLNGGKKAAGRLLDGRTWDEFPA